MRSAALATRSPSLAGPKPLSQPRALPDFVVAGVVVFGHRKVFRNLVDLVAAPHVLFLAAGDQVVTAHVELGADIVAGF